MIDVFGRSTYEVTLELTSVDDLFSRPDIDPLDPRYGDHSPTSALEFIANEIYSNGSYRAARATIVVPDVEFRDVADLSAAVRRWASARARVHEHDVAAARWRGTRGLLSGVSLFVVLIALAQIAGDDGDDLVSTLAKGLEVAAWVVLWFPIDTLVVDLATPARSAIVRRGPGHGTPRRGGTGLIRPRRDRSEQWGQPARWSMIASIAFSTNSSASRS